MEIVNLELVIQQTITRFHRNRSGEKPLVFLSVAPNLPQIPWNDGSLKEFLRLFVYESLHTAMPDTAIEVLLTRRSELNDINELLALHTAFWIQVRLSGRGLNYDEQSIDDLFRGLGYSCDEWLTIHGSEARLGVFGTRFNPAAKMVVALNSVRGMLKCDLMLPVCEYSAPPSYNARSRSAGAFRTAGLRRNSGLA